MSVVNGQLANQTTFNNGFMSRTAPTTQTVSKVALENPDVESGANINNAQKAINKAFEGVGASGEDDAAINEYANNHFILNGDNRKTAIEKLDDQSFQIKNTVDAHLADTTIHFTESSIDHLNIQNIGTKTHADIDNHLVDSSIHFTEGSIDHLNIMGIGTNTHDEIDTFLIDHETRISDIEVGNITIGGNKIFSGDVTVLGDFEVQGNLTTINSITLEVTDQNILLNKGGTDGSAENAGIDVERPLGNAALRFDSALSSKWKIGLTSALYEIVVSGIAQVISGIKDFISGIKTDVVNESSLNAGVTIDAVLIKDGKVSGRDISIDGLSQDTHIADATIHFTEGSIDHLNIQNVGTNSHANIDTHIADNSIHFSETSIDHLNIQNIGINSHADIDNHIIDVSNPHNVTQSQIGLSNVTNDSQLKRSGADIDSFPELLVPTASDILLIEDSNDLFNKKKIKIGSLPSSGGGGGGKKTFSMKINGLYGGSAPINAADGFWIAPNNIQITNAYMYQDLPGTSGTTTLDLKVKPFLSGAFTSVFLTNPSMLFSAGNNAWGGVGDLVTGFTSPVFTSFPFAVSAKSALRLDLTTSQLGGAAGTGLVIEYEDI